MTSNIEALLQHGTDWTGQDLAGYAMGEKFDGCRAYWDGASLWSRGGLEVVLPAHWRDQLPTGYALDCELYDGPGGRSRCAVAITHGRILPTMRLIAFDAPGEGGDFTRRLARAQSATAGSDVVSCVARRPCESTADALRELARVQARRGEGLMMVAPGNRYRPGRTCELIKVKAPRWKA